MRNVLKKKVTMLVLLVFFSINVSPGYFFGQTIVNDLDAARKFYLEGDYDRAIELFDRFIEKSMATKSLYTNELSEAYYYKAKIYFTGQDYGEMAKNLRDLYELNLDYKFSQDEDNDSDFLKRASDIKKLVEQEKIEKDKKERERIEKEKKERERKEEEEKKKKEMEQEIIEQERLRRARKKFPVLLVVGAVVVAGVVVAVLMSKKKTEKEKTLNVTVGEGIDGSPATGTYTHKQGSSIHYNYTLKNEYTNLIVKLDGADAPASGTIAMDKDHTLTASATAKQTYTFTVTRGEGVDGNPASGMFSYNDGDTVNYSYTLQDGYKDLIVKIDGLDAQASGTVTMNGNHTLSASATKVNGFTLTVTRGPGINGTPETNVYIYNQVTTVTYNYSLMTNYQNLTVTLDGNPVASNGTTSNGTITMDRNHTLIAAATRVYTLTVALGEGVAGNPTQGTYTKNEGEDVPYNYSLITGYKNLKVSIDGIEVPAIGTITMNENHTITTAAEKNQYKLTVIKGSGVNGTPGSGTYYYDDGDQVSYSYKVAGSSGTVIVTVDGVTKSSSGNITMNKDHTLTATWQPPGDSKYTNAAYELGVTPEKSIKEGK